MFHKILTIIFAIIFYIVRLPIILLKDFVLVLYAPFDMERFWITYQNALANFSVGEKVLKKQIKNELIIEEDTTVEEKTTIGFKTYSTGLETPQSPAESGIIEND